MRSTLLSVVFLSLGGAALAEPVKGMWVTEPDRKGQVAHVEVYDCGASAVCGKIVRTFNQQGTEIVTENVGSRVFWDMLPKGQGQYEGRAYVPAHGRDYNAEMQLAGNRLTVEGCLGPVCMGQTWRRVE